MKKYSIALAALFLAVFFVSLSYAETVSEVKAKFHQAKKAYILAKEKLSDAEIESLLTFGKAEKRKAVEKIRNARLEVRAARKAYREALRILHRAELERDSQRQRPAPWK